MPTKEKILKEFKKMFVLASSSFDTPVIVMGGEEYETLEPIKSFLSSSLDTYGKEQREGGKLEGWNGAQEVAASKYYPAIKEARAQALDEAIAAVEKIDNPYPKHIFSEPWKGWEKDLDELAKKHGKRIDNISADYARRYFELGKKEALSTLNALRKK